MWRMKRTGETWLVKFAMRTAHHGRFADCGGLVHDRATRTLWYFLSWTAACPIMILFRCAVAVTGPKLTSSVCKYTRKSERSRKESELEMRGEEETFAFALRLFPFQRRRICCIAMTDYGNLCFILIDSRQ